MVDSYLMSNSWDLAFCWYIFAIPPYSAAFSHGFFRKAAEFAALP